ncbi:domain-containing protein [Lichtheimia corymbifera JMRC:FSU:9682]|uniref:Domain-containing protein n=1 Tax=Lichtheimia corymbifera JMRC:FSU:9682 TaxID=1263082 RepID=A0A068RXA9_9FUNG|nr:domain-containing protein [Lichtheimia corymbifera JMRC:FSU:9682]
MAPASSLLPDDADLYEILTLNRESATASDIKSQYRKLALKYHPDKQRPSATDEDKQAATLQFQRIGLAYSILSDPAKKSLYDKTGTISSDDGLAGDKSWTDYFKELWTGVVNAETIEQFASQYRGSDEEERDVLRYYQQCNGNMDRILSHVECSELTDGERLAEIIQKAIDRGDATTLKEFKSTTTAKAHRARAKQHQRQVKEWNAKHGQKNEKKDGDQSLLALIQARNKERAAKLDALADSIAARTAEASSSTSKGGKKRNKRQAEAEEGPSEEEFQKIQERLMENKRRKAK